MNYNLYILYCLLANPRVYKFKNSMKKSLQTFRPVLPKNYSTRIVVIDIAKSLDKICFHDGDNIK